MDVTQILVTLITGCFGLLGIIATYIIQKRLGDSQTAQTLNAAVKNSLGALQQAATAGVQGVQIKGVPALLTPAVQYVLNHAGTEATAAMKSSAFNDVGLYIADKVNAQIGLAHIASNISTAASPAPTPLPLAPVQAPLPTAIPTLVGKLS